MHLNDEGLWGEGPGDWDLEEDLIVYHVDL